MRYTSIYEVLSSLRRNIKFNFEESDVIEWAGEALRAINAAAAYEEAVAFIEVREHKALIPSGLLHIIQVARNNCWEKSCCPADIAAVRLATAVDCEGKTIPLSAQSNYSPFFSVNLEYENWTSSSDSACFSPIRLADHTFFNSLVCTENKSHEIYASARDEYSIADPYMRFSFREGQIALAYRKVKLDEKGYPMIPDNPSYRAAIEHYIRMRVAYHKWDTGEAGANQYLAKAESDWHWYAGQSRNSVKMPQNLDEWQDLLEQKNYLLPRVNRFYGFFGKLAEPEVRTWNEMGYTGYSSYALDAVPVTEITELVGEDGVTPPTAPSSGYITPVELEVVAAGTYTIAAGRILELIVAESTATGTIEVGLVAAGSDIIADTLIANVPGVFRLDLYFPTTTTIHFTGTFTARLYIR